MSRKFPLLILAICYFNITYSQKMDKQLSYLALGDSYTIGESVPSEQNFPHQTTALLKKAGYKIGDPLIIAKTGWTTDELQDAINKAKPSKTYDIVTLLIGVNNQYRGRSESEYSKQFDSLLKQAIAFAQDKPDHVFVLSIPDWGVTPFAEGRDRVKIASEIDMYNSINKKISELYGVHYIDITPGTREAVSDLRLLAQDGLHPSGKDYGRWASLLINKIMSIIK